MPDESGPKTECESQKMSRFERFFNCVLNTDQFLEKKADVVLIKLVNVLRYMFILIMMTYLAFCLVSLGHKLFASMIAQGVLDFASIKTILTDGLFVLIVLAIVKTLFIRNGFDYAVTFLEITFVVLVRKMILLETDPSETWLLLVLGGTSALFFVLIVYIHILRKKDAGEKAA